VPMVELAAAKEPVSSEVVKQKLFSLCGLDGEEEPAAPYAALVISEEIKIPPTKSMVTVTVAVINMEEVLEGIDVKLIDGYFINFVVTGSANLMSAGLKPSEYGRR
jgi:hypothetical protein